MIACAECLARSWLLGRLGGHLDNQRGQITALLGLGADALIDAVAGRDAAELRVQLNRFDPAEQRTAIRGAGLVAVCRCDVDYPVRLRELSSPPAVLHVAGRVGCLAEVADGEPVAIVGARRASPYGIQMARALASGLTAAEVPVISGMALGIDSAAHAGALEQAGATVAVLPSGADRPYPSSGRGLYRRILADGAAVSELPPGTAARGWSYPARNRIIAGLAAVTVVVEAGEGSGALLTARAAGQLGRRVGAVPGRVGTAQAQGPNALLAGGAQVIRDAQDVVDLLYGAGVHFVPTRSREPLRPELAQLHAAIAAGEDTAGALARAGFAPDRCLADLAALELAGHIRREPGGRFAAIT